MYLVEKTINKLNSDGYSFFLNPKDLHDVTSRLKKNSYNIYKPYPDSEKNIIYQKKEPQIILFEIITNSPLRHQDILGTLYSLQIDDSLFGDIVITNNYYYFYTFSYMQSFFEMELVKIRNTNVSLVTHDINFLKDYQPVFEEIQIITSSLRIDSVIAKIIHTNRDQIKELIKDKKIIYNYDLLTNPSKIIHKNDTFSIRKYGKYKFEEIKATTKKNNLILKILKYTQN